MNLTGANAENGAADKNRHSVLRFLCLLLLSFSGCAHLPDTWNYTVQVDHQTRETSSYVGVSGPLTYPWQKK